MRMQYLNKESIIRIASKLNLEAGYMGNLASLAKNELIRLSLPDTIFVNDNGPNLTFYNDDYNTEVDAAAAIEELRNLPDNASIDQVWLALGNAVDVQEEPAQMLAKKLWIFR